MNLCHPGTRGASGKQKELLGFWITIPYQCYAHYFGLFVHNLSRVRKKSGKLLFIVTKHTSPKYQLYTAR